MGYSLSKASIHNKAIANLKIAMITFSSLYICHELCKFSNSINIDTKCMNLCQLIVFGS